MGSTTICACRPDLWRDLAEPVVSFRSSNLGSVSRNAVVVVVWGGAFFSLFDLLWDLLSLVEFEMASAMSGWAFLFVSFSLLSCFSDIVPCSVWSVAPSFFGCLFA